MKGIRSLQRALEEEANRKEPEDPVTEKLTTKHGVIFTVDILKDTPVDFSNMEKLGAKMAYEKEKRLLEGLMKIPKKIK